jgi:Outer membrane lipoprotein-sorting protein
MRKNREKKRLCMRSLLVTIVALSFAVTTAAAAPPDAATIVQQMKAALEPAHPGTQKLTIFVHDKLEESTQLVVYQARKRVWDENWMLTVVQAPESLKGIAYLVQERTGQPGRQWVYLPAVRRVRELMPIDAQRDFLGTDFTYADLGFINLHDRTYKLLGMEKHAGVWAYKVQEVPRQQWYYSRIVTWVAADSFLPLQRNYYAPSQKLWKIERFEEIKRIDGVQTSLWITMENLRQDSSSKIEVTDVRYDAAVPDTLFDPDLLSGALASPVWQATAVASVGQEAKP